MRAKKRKRQRSWTCTPMLTEDNILDMTKVPCPRKAKAKSKAPPAAPKAAATTAAPIAARAKPAPTITDSGNARKDKGSTEWRQCPECKFIREVKVKR